MADNSHIEWTDATWNPVTGCSVVSPGCTNCYAMKLAGGRLRHHPSRKGLTVKSKAGPVWNGKVRFNEGWLTQPLNWTRPRMIFVCAHGDLFHEDVPDAWIDQVIAVMALSPHHTFQVLTKRAKRMREYMTLARKTLGSETLGSYECIYNAMGDLGREGLTEPHPYRAAFPNGMPWPLPNVWLGVSAERQQEANERIPMLLQTPAAVRFISAEPLLGPIDLANLGDATFSLNAFSGEAKHLLGMRDKTAGGLDWIIAGGESGHGSRPMHPEWVRSLRDQCAAAGVAFFFKQWGAWAPGECNAGPPTRTERCATWFNDSWSFETITPRVSEETHSDDAPDVYRFGKKVAGRMLDGELHSAMPAVRA